MVWDRGPRLSAQPSWQPPLRCPLAVEQSPPYPSTLVPASERARTRAPRALAGSARSRWGWPRPRRHEAITVTIKWPASSGRQRTEGDETQHRRDESCCHVRRRPPRRRPSTDRSTLRRSPVPQRHRRAFVPHGPELRHAGQWRRLLNGVMAPWARRDPWRDRRGAARSNPVPSADRCGYASSSSSAGVTLESPVPRKTETRPSPSPPASETTSSSAAIASQAFRGHR